MTARIYSLTDRAYTVKTGRFAGSPLRLRHVTAFVRGGNHLIACELTTPVMVPNDYRIDRPLTKIDVPLAELEAL